MLNATFWLRIGLFVERRKNWVNEFDPTRLNQDKPQVANAHDLNLLFINNNRFLAKHFTLLLSLSENLLSFKNVKKYNSLGLANNFEKF